MRSSREHRQRGVALLVVLILLVLMSVMAARISQQFTGNLQRIQYQLSQQKLRWAILSADRQIRSALEKDMADPQKAGAFKQLWDEPLETDVDGVVVKSNVVDGQNCFNVNSLLPSPAAATATPAAVTSTQPDSGDPNAGLSEEEQRKKMVEYLLNSTGINPMTAETLYKQLNDYLGVENSDPNALATDFTQAYASQKPPRVPAHQMMVSISEIKLLPDFPVGYYPRVAQLFCALPTTKTAVNVNTLERDQAPLLSAMFFGSLTAEDVMRLIDQRPETGWETVDSFKEQLEKQFPVKSQSVDLGSYITTTSHFFTVYHSGKTDTLTLRSADALYINADAGSQLLWSRRYRLVD
ncbi:type II secretion system minor pseudopilin GspK [Atlantibacter sp.]|uniref:type II secretion system minor pseudopilin GspK n=1 Tax=Atlantibacter sp. TaxID=1903473 RepID=UPI0028A7E233|nr:type II secretion system minor pseudopilin GspK [Atlantibacter sp.]